MHDECHSVHHSNVLPTTHHPLHPSSILYRGWALSLLHVYLDIVICILDQYTVCIIHIIRASAACIVTSDIWHSWTIPSQDWTAMYKSFSEEGNTETVVC